MESDLLPAIPEVYSIGIKDRAWLKAILEARDVVSDYLSRLQIGAKIPSEVPGYGDAVYPNLWLEFESPIGTRTPSYLIVNDWGTLTFCGVSSDLIELKNLLRFDYVANLFSCSTDFGGEGMGDMGVFGSEWRDIRHLGWLKFGDLTSREITLPTPASTYRLYGIGTKGGTGVKDNYQICRKRTAGDYKWLDIFDKFQSISILKEVNGITKTDIGTTAVEILGIGHRSKVGLTYFNQCRVIFGGVNNETQIFYCRIQYSTDGSTWVDLTAEGASDGTTNEQLVVGAWGNIPTGALADVFIRAIGRAENATADPTYKTIELQLR